MNESSPLLKTWILQSLASLLFVTTSLGSPNDHAGNPEVSPDSFGSVLCAGYLEWHGSRFPYAVIANTSSAAGITVRVWGGGGNLLVITPHELDAATGAIHCQVRRYDTRGHTQCLSPSGRNLEGLDLPGRWISLSNGTLVLAAGSLDGGAGELRTTLIATSGGWVPSSAPAESVRFVKTVETGNRTFLRDRREKFDRWTLAVADQIARGKRFGD